MNSELGIGLIMPVSIGTWNVGKGGLSLSVYGKKPRWLTRWLCKILLEWEWKDKI